MKEDAQKLPIKQQKGKLTGLQSKQDSQRGAAMGRGGRTLSVSSEISEWEKGFRQGTRSYKGSLVHVYTNQALLQEEQHCEVSTQLPKIRTSDTGNLLFCKLLP